MKLRDENPLICINAILQLKLGILPDVLRCWQQQRWPLRSHRCVGARFMVSISRQAHEAASVGSLFHYFDLLALSLVAHNDGSRLTTEADGQRSHLSHCTIVPNQFVFRRTG
jgi:hypothetical protein